MCLKTNSWLSDLKKRIARGLEIPNFELETVPRWDLLLSTPGSRCGEKGKTHSQSLWQITNLSPNCFFCLPCMRLDDISVASFRGRSCHDWAVATEMWAEIMCIMCRSTLVQFPCSIHSFVVSRKGRTSAFRQWCLKKMEGSWVSESLNGRIPSKQLLWIDI